MQVVKDDRVVTQCFYDGGRFDRPFPLHASVIVKEIVSDFSSRDILEGRGGRGRERGGDGGREGGRERERGRWRDGGGEREMEGGRGREGEMEGGREKGEKGREGTSKMPENMFYCIKIHENTYV